MHANKQHDWSRSIVTSDAIPMNNFNANCAQLRNERINQHLDIKKKNVAPLICRRLLLLLTTKHSARQATSGNDLNHPMASKRKLVDKIRNEYDSG